MAAAADILATYRSPRRTLRRMLAEGAGEARCLAVLTGGCALTFVAQWPRLAREAHLVEAHLGGPDLEARMGGALFGWMVVAPLALYLIAGLAHLACRALGGRAAGAESRFALFWALLAASPVALLHGLAAGFAGPGRRIALALGLAWCAAFAVFWVLGMREAGWRR